MRSDQQLPRQEFRESQQWRIDPFTSQQDALMASRYSRGKVDVNGQTRWHSFSGHERNRFFLNQAGEQFADVSALSGLDTPADSRAFAISDFDRDGWCDIILVNANRPLLNVFRNRFPRVQTSAQHFLVLRLIGGNDRADPSDAFSARDAYGATVTVVAGDLRLVREHRCGEGFAAQNSDLMHIGIGAHERIDELTVDWPSGQRHQIRDVPADQFVIAYESAATAPKSRHFDVQRYVAAELATRPAKTVHSQLDLTEILATRSARSRWHMFTSMATWCDACKRNLPQVAHLRQRYGQDALGMWGVPADSIETADELSAYAETYQPSYDLLIEIPPRARDRLLSLMRQQLRSDSLPSTVLTDSDGRVLRIIAGVPTASDIGRLENEVTSLSR